MAGDEGAVECAAPYAGPDRRAIGQNDLPRATPFVVAGSVLLGICAATAVAGATDLRLPSAVRIETVEAVLGGVTATLGTGVALLYLWRWRLTGETVSLRVGVALAVLATGGYAAPGVATMAHGVREHPVVAGIEAAAVVVAAMLLVLAVRAPVIDTRVRAVPTMARVAVTGGALVSVFAMLPEIARSFTTSQEVGSEIALGGRALVAVGLGGLALLWTLRGLRNSRWLFTWVGLMLFALSLAHAESVGILRTGEVGSATAPVLALAGMAFALYGGAQELRRAWFQQQERLFRIQTEMMLREVRRAAEEARHQERRHDARSALLAMQGAVFGLGQLGDDIPTEEREALARALSAEIDRLERLVSATPSPDTSEAFAVAEALDAVVTCHRSNDLGLSVDLPDDLVAWGRPDDTAEAVQLLLDNTRHHAPRSPVLVRATRELGNVIVRVEDRGPGVDPGERESIFERGRKGLRGARDGSGLGLHIARRLMRDQGGDVWVEGRPGGGASFVLFVPAADAREGAMLPFDQVEEGALP